MDKEDLMVGNGCLIGITIILLFFLGLAYISKTNEHPNTIEQHYNECLRRNEDTRAREEFCLPILDKR